MLCIVSIPRRYAKNFAHVGHFSPDVLFQSLVGTLKTFLILEFLDHAIKFQSLVGTLKTSVA